MNVSPQKKKKKPKKKSVKLPLGHKNLNIWGLTLQIEKLMSIDNYLLTSMTSFFINDRKRYQDWTHHHGFLGLSTSKSWHAFNGWCTGWLFWFTISKFQKFPVAIPTWEFLKKHTLWSFPKYRDKFENPNTYLSLQKT